MAGIHRRTIQKDLHDPDNHNGVITDLEPDILECEVKWALESITTNKARNSSWAISNPERWCCESAALNMPANLENSALATGLENISFPSNTKERFFYEKPELSCNCYSTLPRETEWVCLYLTYWLALWLFYRVYFAPCQVFYFPQVKIYAFFKQIFQSSPSLALLSSDTFQVSFISTEI